MAFVYRGKQIHVDATGSRGNTRGLWLGPFLVLFSIALMLGLAIGLGLGRLRSPGLRTLRCGLVKAIDHLS